MTRVAGSCTFHDVRVVGVFLFLTASAGTAYATWAAFNKSRPRDVLFAVAAPIAALLALTGLVLVFVPDFFG